MRELQSLSLDISAYKVVSDGSQNFEATEVDLITPSKFNSITNSQQQSTDNLTDTVSSFNLTKDIMLRKTNDK
jgi:hypothetical protein